MQVLGADTDAQMIYTPWYNGGDLLQYMGSFENESMPSGTIAYNIVYNGVRSALDFLHDNGLAHCDLKPDNIYLEVDNNRIPTLAVVGDFGSCAELDTVVKDGAELYKLGDVASVDRDHYALVLLCFAMALSQTSLEHILGDQTKKSKNEGKAGLIGVIAAVNKRNTDKEWTWCLQLETAMLRRLGATHSGGNTKLAAYMAK
jgi:serine/threonine protein kinase